VSTKRIEHERLETNGKCNAGLESRGYEGPARMMARSGAAATADSAWSWGWPVAHGEGGGQVPAREETAVHHANIRNDGAVRAMAGSTAR